jgi:glycosyltransferase involved in cell wall biosynthesis
MDLAVAPYPDVDGFYFSPLKIYEYLAAGVPVLATAVGQLPALLAPPGRPDLGALCAPGSRHHLAAAVAALRHDPGRRAALSTRGRAAAVADHDWAMVVDRILRLAAASHRTEPDVPKAS